MLRANVPPERVSVIPNAVDSSRFVPDLTLRPTSPDLNIIIMSRLVYRKGVDLLVEIIPRVCPSEHSVRDGPTPRSSGVCIRTCG